VLFRSRMSEHFDELVAAIDEQRAILFVGRGFP